MNTFIKTRFSIAVFAMVVASLIALPGSAIAGKPVVEEISFTDSAEVCGLAVEISGSGTITTHIQREPVAGFFFGVQKHKLSIQYTGPNGTTLTEVYNRTLNDVSAVDNGDGTWSFTFAFNGGALTLKDGNTVLARDTGRLVITETWDVGDPNVEGDESFVSSTIDFVNGPHPLFDSSYFCEVFTEAMG